MVMEEFVKLSFQRHQEFENSVKAKQHHKLKHEDLGIIKPLNKEGDTKNIISDTDNDDLVKQLKSLNELYKSGVLTKEEFEKAKKNILN